jgi:predicted transcriptional regulator
MPLDLTDEELVTAATACRLDLLARRLDRPRSRLLREAVGLLLAKHERRGTP